MTFITGSYSSLIFLCLAFKIVHSVRADSAGLPLLTTSEKQREYNQSYPGCWLGDRFHMAGDRWSPVMEPFGRMTCVKCQCAQVVKHGKIQLEGKVVCRNIKYDCPPTRCDRPVHRDDTCCRICPHMKRPYFEDQFLPNTEVPHEEESLLHDSTDMSALLVGRSPVMRRGARTRAVAVIHLTSLGENSFQYTIRYRRLRRPIGLIISDEYGTELVRTPLSNQKSRTGVIHASWTNVPPNYMQYIKQGLSYVIITTSRRKAGEIAGKLTYTNMATQGHFEAVLSPPINTGIGGFVTLVYDDSTSVATYSVDIGGVKFSKKEPADFFVTFERDTAIVEQHLLTASPVVMGKLHVDSKFSKQLARGRLQVRVTSRSGETMIGSIKPRAMRKDVLRVFQGTGKMSNVTGFIILRLLESGAIKFKVSVSGMYASLTGLTIQRFCQRRSAWKTLTSLEGVTRRVDIGKVVATGVHKKVRAWDTVAMLGGRVRLRLRAYRHTIVTDPLRNIERQNTDLFSDSYQILFGQGCSLTTAYVWYSLDDQCSLSYFVDTTVPGAALGPLEVVFSSIDTRPQTDVRGLGAFDEIANITELLVDKASRTLSLQIALYFRRQDCDRLVSRISLENTCRVGYPTDNSADREPGLSQGTVYRCFYEGSFYTHGDSWLPEADSCVTCRCDRGNVHCDDVICPRRPCLVPVRRAGECCSVCEEENETEKKHLGSCYFHGDKRWHPVGVDWHPYIPPFGYSKCAVCRCLPESLEVNCTRLPCPRLDCPMSRRVRLHRDDCCQVCDGTHLRRMSDVINLLDVQPKDCVFSGRHYKHGETWHPALKPFGEMKCYTCTCKKGKTTCKKTKCPKLRCRQAYKPAGQCCTVCLDQRTRYSSEELFRSMSGDAGG